MAAVTPAARPLVLPAARRGPSTVLRGNARLGLPSFNPSRARPSRRSTATRAIAEDLSTTRARNNGNGNGNGAGNAHAVTDVVILAKATPAAVEVAAGVVPAAAAAAPVAVVAPVPPLKLEPPVIVAAVAPAASVNWRTDAGEAEPTKASGSGVPQGLEYLATNPTVAEPPGGRWSRFKGYSFLQRSFEIWRFIFSFFFKRWLIAQKWSYKSREGGMTPAAQLERNKILAVWLREGLLRLGPTFIKAGQQFSTRVDVLSREYITELEKLQDEVPPFSSDQAMAIVAQELGRPINTVYDEFEATPIAAASLGQVHRARIGGERVVVKVQRPGLRELFDIDLKNLRVLAEWLQKVDPKTDGAARDWVAIYDECSRILYEEIDYRKEAENATQFRDNFKAEDWVKVPKVYPEFTTSRILTLEYAPGVKINRLADIDKLGLDRARLARLTVESYLQQILRHGLFHADPHPGNISVDAAGGGRLIFYDFGMMGTIAPGIRKGLLDLFYAVYEKSAPKCIDALVVMGVLIPTGDMTAVRRTAQFFLDSFSERLAAQQAERAVQGADYNKNFKDPRSAEEKKLKKKEILANIGEDLLAISADQPFRFPATFTFVVRAFSVLDGIGKGLDPRFDISEIARPYARELLLEARPQYSKVQSEVVAAFDRQNKSLYNLFQGPDRIQTLENTIGKLSRGDLKLRVRALETERALQRVMQMQKNTQQVILFATALNIGTVLAVSAMQNAATAAFVAGGLFMLALLGGIIKLALLERKEKQLAGT